MTSTAVTTTREHVHGLLRLRGDTLTIQWRLTTKVDHVGTSIRSEQTVEPVRELAVPVWRLAGATVQRKWLRWLPGLRVVLAASDLTALENLAGTHGLRLNHPAELELTIRSSDRLIAEEFCAELALAISESMGNPEARLPGPSATALRPPDRDDDRPALLE
ncbi:MAG: hypothetical protein HKO53_03825 [Gemmatimonadetes bacterium]|nr:hypothetical protein [Gemmatimonadota bacterium]NNM32165.1 hypothetical protein [Gemmatimonadota bacterium]